MDFESAMADVKKVVNFKSPQELKVFSNEILKLSTKIPIAAEGLSAIAASGGQLGITKDKLLGFTQIVAKMSTAFDMSADDAGDSVAKLMNVYGLSLVAVRILGDAVNHLSDNTAAKAKDIVNVLARVGGTAKMFGLNAKQVAALSDAFLAMGKPPEVAATAINAMLTKLMTANKQGKKFQGGLKAIGVSSKKLMQELKKDPNKALLNFLEKIKKFDKQKQMSILSDLFGMEYSDDIALLIGGLDNYKKALKLTAKEQNYLNSMQKEFENRSATTANKLQLLKNSTTKIGIALGTIFLPVVKEGAVVLGKMANKVSDFVEKHPQMAKAIGSVAGGLGAIAVVGAVVGYGLSFIAGGFVRVGAAGLMVSNNLKRLKQFLRGGLGFRNIKSASLKSGLCGIGNCASSSKAKLGGLKKEVGLARSAFSKPLVIGVSLVGAAAVIAGLNSIAKASHTAIMDKRAVMATGIGGSYSKEDLAKLKEKERRLKERLKAAKEGGFGGALESFLHGSNDKYKIEQLEKLLKRTQSNIKRAESGWKPVVSKTHTVSKKEIVKAISYNTKVKEIWKLNIADVEKRKLIKLLADGKNIDVKIKEYKEKFGVNRTVTKNNVVTKNISSVVQKVSKKDTKGLQNNENIKRLSDVLAKANSTNSTLANSALAEVKNTKMQIDALQNTVKTMANRPPVNNYHINVNVSGQNPADVERAVKKALADVEYIKTQRSLSDS